MGHSRITTTERYLHAHTARDRAGHPVQPRARRESRASEGLPDLAKLGSQRTAG
jgi:hypothetical protein